METWFAKEILRWYKQNKRDLPWRQEKDAYKIWLSEIILQQTQVAQGLSYYLKFTTQYSTVKSLANATEDDILRLWQGLGYYSRARNLHFAAKSILLNKKGVFPSTYEEIRALKGVGDYTAAAIASFAFDLPYAVVDGNVYRVLSRVFGIFSPIDTQTAKKEFQLLATHLLYKKDPATYNQAIMEFGSQFCKPTRPDCENCALNNKCYAFKQHAVADLPTKAKKTKVRNRYFTYLVLKDKRGHVQIHRRNKSDIWQGLYEFSLIESTLELTQEALLRLPEFMELAGTNYGIKFISKRYKHILSHQHLYATFYIIHVNRTFNTGQTKKKHINGTNSTKPEKLQAFAFPRLIGKFLDDCLLKELI
jgi:A/G-specific adenine glycosylase